MNILETIEAGANRRGVYTFIYPENEDGQDFITVLAHDEAEAKQTAMRELSGCFGAKFLELWEVE